MRHSYKTQSTCTAEIDFDITNDTVSNVHFTGGCNGNLKTLPILLLLESGKAEGFICGRRPTPCSDQLAIALKEATHHCKA